MSLLKNSTIVITGVIISNLLAYVFHFVAGRMLGPEDYGTFGALMALFLLVALPAGALASAVTKFTSRYIAEQQPGKIVQLRKKIQDGVLIFAGAMLLIIILFSPNIAGYLRISSRIPVILVGVTLIFALLLPVNKGILLGMKKYIALSWNTIIEALSRLLLLLAILLLGYGVNGAVLAYGGAYLIAFLLVFPFIREIQTDRTGDQKIEIKPVYRFIFLVLIANLMIQSIINLPSLYVKHFYSSEITGYWTAALNIARISLFITSSISMTMFPVVAGEKDLLKNKKTFGNTALLVFLASSCMAAIFFLVPEIFIKALYGAEYLGAVPFLQWMGVAMIFIGFLQLRIDYFLARLK